MLRWINIGESTGHFQSFYPVPIPPPLPPSQPEYEKKSCKSTNKKILALLYLLRVIDYNFPIILSLKIVFIIQTNGAESDEMLIRAMYDYLGQHMRFWDFYTSEQTRLCLACP